MADAIQPELDIRLWRPGADASEVPFPLLLRVLGAMQQIIYLLALQHEGRGFRDRLRLPDEITRKYVLVATVPEAGSFIQPSRLGDPTSDLFAVDDLLAVMKRYELVSEALSSGDSTAVVSLLPDRSLRDRVLRNVQELLPPADSGWRVNVQLREKTFAMNAETIATVVSDLHAEYYTGATGSLIGKVMRIDFEAKKLTLRFPPTRRTVACYYLESVEELLVKRGRELIQVVGELTLDQNGNPVSISAVASDHTGTTSVETPHVVPGSSHPMAGPPDKRP